MAEDRVPESGEGSGDKISYVKAALNWQYNWIGLGAAAALALVTGTGLPLLLAAGLEMMYLSLVPQSSRFRRLVRSWQYAEERKKHEQRLRELFRDLPQPMRARYADLDRLCRAIRENYARLSSTSQIFVKQIEERLVGLAHSYLRLLHAAWQHREYLRTTDPAAIERELHQLERSLESEAARVQEINRKRIEILKKRIDKHEKIQENCSVVDAQCAAIEDVLKLIRDQSVTMRDPSEITDQLDHLVADVEQTEQTVREVEAIFEMAAPEAPVPAPPLPFGTSSSTEGSPRTRVRN